MDKLILMLFLLIFSLRFIHTKIIFDKLKLCWFHKKNLSEIHVDLMEKTLFF